MKLNKISSNLIMKKDIRIGTRSSKLALWQANFVKTFLINNFADINIEIVPITTQGDKNQIDSIDSVGGKGVFIKEIEEALIKKEIDIAVHSYKDVPINIPEELEIVGTSNREDPRDVLITLSKSNLYQLIPHSVIGTGSARRTEQIKGIRSNIEIKPIRGNVNTRIDKLNSGKYDGIVLAYAGIKRLKLENYISQAFPVNELVPAPLQGFLAIESRSDSDWFKYFQNFSDETNSIISNYERRFSKDLNLSCELPIGFCIQINDKKILFSYFIKGSKGNIKKHFESHYDELDSAYNNILSEIDSII